MSAQNRGQKVGEAISHGLDGLLITSTVMLLVALIWAPVRSQTLLLIGLPFAIALIFAGLATADKL